jgi:prepilin-type processing-associated H-X9-DG protein
LRVAMDATSCSRNCFWSGWRWATGGVSTHFSLCGDGCRSPNKPHFETPGSHHIGGVNLVMADGSVKFVSDSITLELLEAIGGMADKSTEQFVD